MSWKCVPMLHVSKLQNVTDVKCNSYFNAGNVLWIEIHAFDILWVHSLFAIRLGTLLQ